MAKTPHIGNFRHKIAVWKLRPLDDQILDAGGNPTKEENEILVEHRYAEVRTASRGANVEGGQQIQEIITHMIRIRNDSFVRKINASYWFILNGVRFDIVAAPDAGFADRHFCNFDCRTVSGDG